LFTSEDSANLLQYRLFDVAPPLRINRKARLCSRHANKEWQQLWQQKRHDKNNHLLLLCHTQKHFATTFIGIM
jgi:hypothetical protein